MMEASTFEDFKLRIQSQLQATTTTSSTSSRRTSSFTTTSVSTLHSKLKHSTSLELLSCQKKAIAFEKLLQIEKKDQLTNEFQLFKLKTLEREQIWYRKRQARRRIYAFITYCSLKKLQQRQYMKRCWQKWMRAFKVVLYTAQRVLFQWWVRYKPKEWTPNESVMYNVQEYPAFFVHLTNEQECTRLDNCTTSDYHSIRIQLNTIRRFRVVENVSLMSCIDNINSDCTSSSSSAANSTYNCSETVHTMNNTSTNTNYILSTNSYKTIGSTSSILNDASNSNNTGNTISNGTNIGNSGQYCSKIPTRTSTNTNTTSVTTTRTIQFQIETLLTQSNTIIASNMSPVYQNNDHANVIKLHHQMYHDMSNEPNSMELQSFVRYGIVQCDIQQYAPELQTCTSIGQVQIPLHLMTSNGSSKHSLSQWFPIANTSNTTTFQVYGEVYLQIQYTIPVDQEYMSTTRPTTTNFNPIVPTIKIIANTGTNFKTTNKTSELVVPLSKCTETSSSHTSTSQYLMKLNARIKQHQQHHNGNDRPSTTTTTTMNSISTTAMSTTTMNSPYINTNYSVMDGGTSNDRSSTSLLDNIDNSNDMDPTGTTSTTSRTESSIVKKPFLKRKPYEVKFQKLDWSKICSKTNSNLNQVVCQSKKQPLKWEGASSSSTTKSVKGVTSRSSTTMTSPLSKGSKKSVLPPPVPTSLQLSHAPSNDKTELAKLVYGEHRPNHINSQMKTNCTRSTNTTDSTSLKSTEIKLNLMALKQKKELNHIFLSSGTNKYTNFQYPQLRKFHTVTNPMAYANQLQQVTLEYQEMIALFLNQLRKRV